MSTEGNQNASKGGRESFLHIRCEQSDKARWVKAAKGESLSDWVIEALNAKCATLNKTRK